MRAPAERPPADRGGRSRAEWLRLASLACLLAVVLALAGLTAGRRAPALLVHTLPAFSVPDLLQPGATLTAEQLAGSVYLLNVWATWCVPCRQEHGQLLAVAESGEVALVGLAWRDRREDALRWLRQLGNPYARVGDDADGAVAAMLGVTAAPETLLVAADGRVLHRHTGPLTAQAWEHELLPLLAGTKGAP